MTDTITHHTFTPWRAGDGTRVVAAESAWKRPLAWDRAAAKAGERRRVLVTPDVFEDWGGLLIYRTGAVAYVCTECGAWQAMEDMCCGPNAHYPLTLADVRRRLFGLIDRTPHLDWLIVTDRPENLREMLPWHDVVPGGWPMRNVWLAARVTSQADADARLPHLLRVPAVARLAWADPLLGPVRIPAGIDGVIVGGETGPDARPMHPAWVRDIRDQCDAAGVPFFFRGYGEWGIGGAGSVCVGDDGTFCPTRGPILCDRPDDRKHLHALMARVGAKASGRLLDGREHNQLPEVSRAT